MVEVAAKRRRAVAAGSSARRSQSSQLRGRDLAAAAAALDRWVPMQRLAGAYDLGRPHLPTSLGHLLQEAIPQLDRCVFDCEAGEFLCPSKH